MLYLKKYFTEGLIQMAILLSLCGVRVDVGLEPYLPPSWQEMILGPTSALIQTQFHNLHNRLEDGQGLHPKSVDLDEFFTARRLLGWVRSLDRLQVPHAELETWLVEREPDPLPMRCPDQPSPLGRANARIERDRRALPEESRGGALQEEGEEGEEEDKEEGTHHVLQHSGTLDEIGEEEEEEGLARMHRLHRRTEEGGEPGPSYEVDQTVSLQECFRLLDETFPFTEEQLQDVDARGGELERRPPGREPLLHPTENPSMDLELQWQDLLAIMEPQNTEVDMMSSFDDTWDSRATGTPQGVGSEALWPNRYNHNYNVTAGQEILLMETPLQHGLSGPQRESELEPTLLPLTPTVELDDHSSSLNNSNLNPLHNFPDHTDPPEDFCQGLNADDKLSTLNINLLKQDLVDTMECGPCSQYAPFLSSYDDNFHSSDLTPSSFTSSTKENGMTEDLLTSPSTAFPFDEEDAMDEDGLPSPLGDLLEDSAILDEIRLLDLALDEGFGSEMAARLEDEGFLDPEISQQETGRDDDHAGIAITEDQGQPRRYQPGGEIEADSDSGLSLDLNHSPVSPCASEASDYSSSSSCVSDVGSPFSEDEDEDAEELFISTDAKAEVTIKQEELEEESMGAVGGRYPEDVKNPFPPNYGNHKLLNGFPWLEHIGHDHTYNQPWSFASSPSLGKMPTKHTKSPPRHDNAKPYHSSCSRHISKKKQMWSRDERRAQTLKVPFSNELIVNLPVEDFNDLLANYQLNEEQLTLVRDIRRRGKNKVAAQNCRKRKLNVLMGLKDNVLGLRRYRSRLLREKQEALSKLQKMKHQLGLLYQDVFSRLTNEEGRPLNAMEYMLHFEPNGSIIVASRKQGAVLPLTKNSKKQRDKK